ncbi:unnamed protein product, partial [Polarella glacialis]
ADVAAAAVAAAAAAASAAPRSASPNQGGAPMSCGGCWRPMQFTPRGARATPRGAGGSATPAASMLVSSPGMSWRGASASAISTPRAGVDGGEPNPASLAAAVREATGPQVVNRSSGNGPAAMPIPQGSGINECAAALGVLLREAFSAHPGGEDWQAAAATAAAKTLASRAAAAAARAATQAVPASSPPLAWAARQSLVSPVSPVYQVAPVAPIWASVAVPPSARVVRSTVASPGPPSFRAVASAAVPMMPSGCASVTFGGAVTPAPTPPWGSPPGSEIRRMPSAPTLAGRHPSTPMAQAARTAIPAGIATVGHPSAHCSFRQPQPQISQTISWAGPQQR